MAFLNPALSFETAGRGGILSPASGDPNGAPIEVETVEHAGGVSLAIGSKLPDGTWATVAVHLIPEHAQTVLRNLEWALYGRRSLRQRLNAIARIIRWG